MDIKPGIFAVFKDDEIVGTGFLVGQNLAITCAHVVIAADALDGDSVQIRFSGQAEKIDALVMPEYWRDAENGDVAILKLDYIPKSVLPLRLGTAATSRPGNQFYSFGYATAADVQGIATRGPIISYLPDSKYLQIRSHEAHHGMSGAPVLDEKRGVIVGMITKGHNELGRNEETTFAIPSEIIWQICPQLKPPTPNLPRHNPIVEGINLLPYDYDQRIQNFLTEYLGSDQHPVPFGGRDEALRMLDGWLATPTPYLLLAAPAGRGKSALLVRWLDILKAREDLALAFVPVSVRFGTNMERVFYAALAARLAFLHGDDIPTSPETSTAVYRGLVSDYLSKPLANGRTLLVVLDGLDEAADWQAGADFMPGELPASVRVAVSARFLAGDADSTSWLRRLNWERNNLASAPSLTPLDRAVVADVLFRMGYSLDELSQDVDIIAAWNRLSDGDSTDANMTTSYDHDLQSYFTGMEHLRSMFAEYVSAPVLPKRMMVFHGVGGVGKSSLLRMFGLHCKTEKIPVGLASGDDAKSLMDVITRWTEDLKVDGIKFPALSKTLDAYRTIQAKVEDQVKKNQNRVAEIASKAASKTAETAGGAFLDAAIGSIIPGVGIAIGGTQGDLVRSMGAEALTDWLRGFLSKPDVNLLLDPAKKLSTDFLEDLAKAAGKKRSVLLLDTFEQMSALEDWVGEAAQKVHPNVLVVIAGRKLPDWNRIWPDWMMNAHIEELKPMTEDIMRALIHRYYATLREGKPAPAQVEAIIRFARGLPMVVTSAVQLWVKYGVEDFQSVKAEIVANLVDRLMEGVPGSLIPALEAAAAVRWFDQPILRAVTGLDDVRYVYNELRRFSFVRSRAEGLALHDSVREIMDENLRVQDSEQHSELHERAALYFEKRLEKVTGDDAEKLGLERLYHRIRADEEDGINLFQEMADELYQHRFVNRLRSLMSDVNVYPLTRENSNQWREYYKAKLAGLEPSWKNNHIEATYEALANDLHADPKLRAFAMCDLSTHLTRSSLLKEPEGVDKALEIIKKCQGLIFHLTDGRRDIVLKNLTNVYVFRGEREKVLKIFEQRLDYFNKKKDTYGIINNLQRIRLCYAEIGNWQKALTIRQRLTSTLQEIQIPSKLIDQVIIRDSQVEVIYTGRYFDAEQTCRQALKLCEDTDVLWSFVEPLRGLAYALGLQTKYDEAELLFTKIMEDALKQNSEWEGETTYLRLGEIIAYRGDLSRSQEFLLKSLADEERIGSNGVALNSSRLGKLHEVKSQVLNSPSDLLISESYYRKAINYQWSGRLYHHCTALTGLIRVKHAQGDIAAIPPLLAEAEQLAQQYEYNDHLASLRLTQGHLRAETSEVSETSEVWSRLSALDYYKQAMLYALRYNRFLLDELVSGRPQGTPLRPIIPACLERGAAGKTMLLALRDWWKTGINDIGAPRPDTISPIPEGLALLEAEKLAREREPGDGSAQKSVVEQIEAAL